LIEHQTNWTFLTSHTRGEERRGEERKEKKRKEKKRKEKKRKEKKRKEKTRSFPSLLFTPLQKEIVVGNPFFGCYLSSRPAK